MDSEEKKIINPNMPIENVCPYMSGAVLATGQQGGIVFHLQKCIKTQCACFINCQVPDTSTSGKVN